MATVPSAPQGLSWPECTNQQIRFYWLAPSSNGGSPILKYTLFCSEIAYSQDVSANVQDVRVTGLTNGVEYTFKVTATNAIGTSEIATYPTVQPGISPFGPSIATVSTLNVSTAYLSWTPSSFTGEGKLRAYVIQGLPSSTGISSFFTTQDPFKTTLTVPGLSTNNYYQFLVRGVNDIGYSSPFAYTSTLFFGFTATFLPSDVAGLSLWLDAQDAATVTSSGGYASQWNDKSGQSYNLTQATGGSQPAYASSAMTFSGNRFFNIPAASINNASAYCYFFVFTPVAALNWITVKQRDGTNTYNVLSMTNTTNSGGQNTAGTSQYLYFHNQNNGTVANSGSALTLSQQQLITITFDGTNFIMYRNGTQLSSTTGTFAIANATTITNYTMGLWNLGGVVQNSGTTNFSMNEFGFYNQGLTTLNRQKLEGYLAWKWGLQDSLPGDHPYRNSPP